jgi:hypothetical protein
LFSPRLRSPSGRRPQPDVFAKRTRRRENGLRTTWFRGLDVKANANGRFLNAQIAMAISQGE